MDWDEEIEAEGRVCFGEGPGKESGGLQLAAGGRPDPGEVTEAC